jgi:NAD+ kinase
MMLEVSLIRNGEAIFHQSVLNDVVVHGAQAECIGILVKCNDIPITHFSGDGIIVATPTGSTAYSLSNGGPIITPQAGIVCLTPVAPHSLNVRPIVLRDDAVISLVVESRSHNFLIAIDGRSERCEEGTRLVIRKAPYYINIVKRPGTKYFATLREKMGWGM